MRDIKIKNSLLRKYLYSLIISFMHTIKRSIEDKWINLKRKKILLNSKGSKNCSLLSPSDMGNKIYCWTKEVNEILHNASVIKKREMIIPEPNKPRTIFLISKLKIK